MTGTETDIATDLTSRYQQVRSTTEWLAEPLGAEDQTVQSMPDVSPTKWHRAHVTWFFETFVLGPHAPDHRPYDRDFEFLFNSYYEAVGPRHPRPERGLVTRPGVGEVMAYRQVVDDAMVALLDGGVDPGVADLVELGLHHEQQHQELLLMDIKHVLSKNPTRVAYRPPANPPAHHSATAIRTESSRPAWLDVEGGLVEIGHDGPEFAFDNEGPRHRVWLEPYRIAEGLVTCGEWQEFMDDGGYRRPEFWLSEGWAICQAQGWDAPLYWRRRDEGWNRFTLAGESRVDPAEPVCHVSHFEADAFAAWSGARLPTESEWEHAVALHGRSDDRTHRLGWHPSPDRSEADGSLRQWCGAVWQWTASPYVGYPGFRPAAGAVGEYNGKFMSNQMVLRGGACITPEGHTRPTYRNFFPSSARWAFGGLRLAADA